MTALLIKEAVNQTVDNMGFYNALNACFTLHELNHSHWAWVNDDRLPGGQGGLGHPELEGGAADRARASRTRCAPTSVSVEGGRDTTPC